MSGVKFFPVNNMELIYTLSTMAEEIWHEYFTPMIGSEQVEYMLEKFLSPEAIEENINGGYEYHLFTSDYIFAGFTGIQVKDGSMFLSKLYIHEDFRGNKLASHVFNQLVGICKKRNLDKIWLTCNRNNTNSIEIYKHWGFEIVREKVTDIGGGFVMDDYILEYKVK